MRTDIAKICRNAKKASRMLALVPEKKKNAALINMGKALNKSAKYILAANKKDIASAKSKGLSSALIDRLTLTEKRLSAMADSMISIARLKDPIGKVIDSIKRPNGLVIRKVRVPIGVILIIYESRPNVTSDCVALCLKSSNALILRGGSEAIHSNIAIFTVLDKVARRMGLPANSISILNDTDRKLIDELLIETETIDLVIPRGGESLIREVTRKSRIPVIKHYKGVCHTFVDDTADLEMAENICYNAKVQRPGVCNAMETLLVHRKIASRFLPGMIKRLQDAGVEIRGTNEVKRFGTNIVSATEHDWYEEYLDLILSIKLVKNVDEAIEHIMRYGSYHSDAIITKSKKNSAKFLREVDSACVFVNASTRFTDGGEFGMGAEMGISTDKIHARGPMGLVELTSYKYTVTGNGQIRK